MEEKLYNITQEQANQLLDLVKNVWIFGDTTQGCTSVGWKEARRKLVSEIENKPYDSVDVLGIILDLEKEEEKNDVKE